VKGDPVTKVLSSRPIGPTHRRAGRRLRRRVLLGLELVTGATAVAGGVLLAVAPDGSLLRADPAALRGSPFSDWRPPGVLLATLVGGGYLLTAWRQRRDGRWARQLSMVAGAGLVTFEAFELAWIGFQPLEGVFAAVGAAVLLLAATDRTTCSDRR
jgi:peptidoglycan/LPS O-acetylase OafA/YrhL